jgi:tetratricopeptide (TPR) repeat protein
MPVPSLVLVLAILGAAGQLRVSSPYLDVVARYKSGDHARAVEDTVAFPLASLSRNAKRDLVDLTCQVLTGTVDCARARESKPVEYERVVEAWTTMLPPAAVLHIDAAVSSQAAGRFDAAAVHRSVAVEIADLIGSLVPADAPGRERRLEVQRGVWLVSIWLQQLRFELAEIEAPLARVRQALPKDPLAALAVGSLHEVRARPHALVEASHGRQGNLAAWRREERTYRLESAAAAYREALALDGKLAEAHLRLGRVLALQGKPDEAEASLARVPETTGDARWKYLSALFRASVAESRDQAGAARAAFEEAAKLWPASQASPLALSRLLAASGDWDSARQHLARLEPAAGGSQDDPWWAYDFGQAWRIESALAELRLVVSR